MKTYKIPAIDLEIQSEDIPNKNTKEGTPDDVWWSGDVRDPLARLGPHGWRPPTDQEFKMLLHLWTLGLLNLKFDESNGYWVREEGVLDIRSGMGRSWIGVNPRLRLVRGLKR